MDDDDTRGDDALGEVDFDTAMNVAWTDYRRRLAAQLCDLDEGSTLIVEQNLDVPDGPRGILTFTRKNHDVIVCTIDEGDLHPHPEVLRTNVAVLELLGWNRDDGDGSFTFEVTRAQPMDLASLVTETLREIWGVTHPAFVTGDPIRQEPAYDIVALPTRHSDLRAMVLDALETMSGHPTLVDDDGDIPLPTGEVKSWLRILPLRPTLEFFGTIVEGVDDSAAAYEFVATETMPYTGIKLIVHHTCIVAVLTVEATAFSRHNVAAGIGQWLQFVEETRPEIIAALTAGSAPTAADRTGADPASDDTADLPLALQKLIEFDGGGEPLDAEEVATLCDHDSEAILDFIDTADHQQLSWAASADRAIVEHNDAEAAACRHECDAWAETARQLRAALRLIARSDDDMHRRPAN